MRHGSDRTEAERCQRCAEVQDEILEAARRANNVDQFYGQLRARMSEASAELEAATGNGDPRRIPVDVEDDTESWSAFEGR